MTLGRPLDRPATGLLTSPLAHLNDQRITLKHQVIYCFSRTAPTKGGDSKRGLQVLTSKDDWCKEVATFRAALQAKFQIILSGIYPT